MRFKESLLNIVELRLICSLLILFAEDAGNLCHQLIHISIIVIKHDFDAGALKREPVAVIPGIIGNPGLIRAALFAGKEGHISIKILPIVLQETYIPGLLIKRPGYDNQHIAPACRPIAEKFIRVYTIRHRGHIAILLGIFIKDFLHLLQKCIRVKIIHRGLRKCLRISGPGQTLIPLVAVCGSRVIITELPEQYIIEKFIDVGIVRRNLSCLL